LRVCYQWGLPRLVFQSLAGLGGIGRFGVWQKKKGGESAILATFGVIKALLSLKPAMLFSNVLTVN
jgi:hypothetical protein